MQIETLFRVHDTNTPLTHLTEGIDAAFHDYFSRFVGIDEPSYVTLHPKTSNKPLERQEPTSPLSDDHRNELSERPDNRDSWLQSYVSHLDENISGDESEVIAIEKEVVPRTPASQNDSSTTAALLDNESTVVQLDEIQAPSAPVDPAATMAGYLPGLGVVTDPAINMLS